MDQENIKQVEIHLLDEETGMNYSIKVSPDDAVRAQKGNFVS